MTFNMDTLYADVDDRDLRRLSAGSVLHGGALVAEHRDCVPPVVAVHRFPVAIEEKDSVDIYRSFLSSGSPPGLSPCITEPIHAMQRRTTWLAELLDDVVLELVDRDSKGNKVSPNLALQGPQDRLFVDAIRSYSTSVMREDGGEVSSENLCDAARNDFDLIEATLKWALARVIERRRCAVHTQEQSTDAPQCGDEGQTGRHGRRERKRARKDPDDNWHPLTQAEEEECASMLDLIANAVMQERCNRGLLGFAPTVAPPAAVKDDGHERLTKRQWKLCHEVVGVLKAAVKGEAGAIDGFTAGEVGKHLVSHAKRHQNVEPPLEGEDQSASRSEIAELPLVTSLREQHSRILQSRDRLAMLQEKYVTLLKRAQGVLEDVAIEAKRLRHEEKEGERLLQSAVVECNALDEIRQIAATYTVQWREAMKLATRGDDDEKRP